MHYFIDGYNLLFFLSSLETDIQQKRQEIIFDFCEKFQLLQLHATIVFDAAFQMGDATRSWVKNLEIIYTSFGESADVFILRQIKNSSYPSKEIVVTSDKGLSLKVKAAQGQIISVKEFLKFIHRRIQNKNRGKKGKLIKVIEIQRPTIPSQFERYLKIFEEKSQDIEYQEQAEINTLKPKEKVTAQEIKETEQHSDFDRWLYLFEKRLKEDI